MQLGQPHHLGALNLKPRQGGGKADRLGQPMFGQAAGARAFQIGMQDEGPGRPGGGFIGINPAVFRQRVKLFIFLGKIGNQSSPS
ncbi:hypothetical protein [Tabrizicola fusiformis]|uniref:hypothetical protein n=1 Tax=Tabrizicola sp. SY72 TaxID=2741673 RepID=UPI001F50C389|nr:hypothetical protein [Tabrizicola sp. SY72]